MQEGAAKGNEMGIVMVAMHGGRHRHGGHARWTESSWWPCMADGIVMAAMHCGWHHGHAWRATWCGWGSLLTTELDWAGTWALLH